MTQTSADKAAAIISLLGLIFWHLDDAPGAMQVKRYGDGEPPEHDGPPRMYNPDCDGRCVKCLDAHKLIGRRPDCPPDEKWWVEFKMLRRKYRVGDVELAVIALADVSIIQAQAVWAKYVEPWGDPKTEPMGEGARAHRDREAGLGIGWLVENIEGEVLAFGTVEPIANQIRRLKAEHPHWSQGRIAKTVKCRKAKVGEVLGATV